MKTRKTRYFGLLITALLLAGTIRAQSRVIEKTFDADRNERVELNLKFGETIVVKGWDREEVSFRATAVINSGKLNDALLVNYYDDQGGIRIDVDYDEEIIKEGKRTDCPDRGFSTYTRNNGQGYVVCSRIVYEIMVPRESNLRLETISADIELNALAGPINAKSISGFVDLSWPRQQGADLSLKTVSGEAYSDLDNLRFLNRREKAPLVGYELRGTIGDGGKRVRLESVSGDLFLRKG